MGPKARGDSLLRDPVFWFVSIALTIALLLTYKSIPLLYSYYAFPLDDGYRLYPPLRLLQGEMLFRDMFTFYPPFSYWLQWLFYEVFGVHSSSIRLTLVFAQVAITCLTYALTKQLCNRFFAVLTSLWVTALGIIFVPIAYSGWYITPLMLVVALFLFHFIDGGYQQKHLIFYVGVASGIALGTKIRDGGLLVLAAGYIIVYLTVVKSYRASENGVASRRSILHFSYLFIPPLMFVAMGKIQHFWQPFYLITPIVVISAMLLYRQLKFVSPEPASSRTLFLELSAFAVGVVLVNAPWFVYYLWQVGAEEVFFQLIELPLAMRDGVFNWSAGNGPVVESWLLAAAALYIILVGSFKSERLRAAMVSLILVMCVVYAVDKGDSIDALISLFGRGLSALVPYFTLVHIGVASFLIYFIKEWKNPSNTTLKIGVLAILSAIMILILVPHADVFHLFWVIAPSQIIFSCAIYKLFESSKNRFYAIGISIVVLFSTLVAFESWRFSRSTVEFMQDPARRANSLRTETIDTAFDDTIGYQQIIDYIQSHTEPGDYIFELPGSLLSFASGRTQAARLDYWCNVDNQSWNEAQEIELIESRKPEYVVYHKGSYSRTPNKYHFCKWNSLFPNVDVYIKTHYQPVFEPGSFIVLQRRGR